MINISDEEEFIQLETAPDGSVYYYKTTERGGKQYIIENDDEECFLQIY